MSERNKLLEQATPKKKAGLINYLPWVLVGAASLFGAYTFGAVGNSQVDQNKELETTEANYVGTNDDGKPLDTGFGNQKEISDREKLLLAENEKLKLNEGENSKAIEELKIKLEAMMANPNEEKEPSDLDKRRAELEEKQKIEEEQRLLQEQTQAQARQALEAELAQKRADAESARLLQEQEQEAERQKQQAQYDAQVNSPPVVTGNAGGANVSFDEGTVGAAQKVFENKDREFLKQTAQASETRRASLIANPSQTVSKGTIIEATLEGAINSDLEGQVTAVTSYPIYSSDSTTILIPAGSRLFGTYSSNVKMTQRRVLVAWTQVTTIDGQSIELESYGADRLGRSGMISEINNHYGSRFGSALVVSLIGLAPDLLAAEISSNTDNEITIDAATESGDTVASAADQALGGYMTQSPTLIVHQGSIVRVVVDQNLEFY